jgi:uncharacterized protein
MQPDLLEISLPARIGVVADTHFGPRRDWLPQELVDGLSSVDLIIHCGDFSTVGALEIFNAFKPTFGVFGNNDEPELVRHLPERLRLRLGERRGVVVHGHNSPGQTARQMVVESYAGKVDLVLFGHSHQARDEVVGGTRFFNPGSATNKRWQPEFSFGIVKVSLGGSIECRLEFYPRQTRPGTRSR